MTRIRERALGWFEALAVGHADAAVRFRALAALYLTAGPLALLTLAMPHGSHAVDWAIAALASTAILIGAALLALARRLPDKGIGAFLALGTLMISLAVVASDDAGTPYAAIYLWAGVEGFFFLRARGAALLNVLIAASYGAALLIVPGDGAAPARWLLTVGACVITSVMTAVLQWRSERLVAELANVARTDALTGLLNRRGFEEALGRIVAAAERSGDQVSLIVADLDHFKRVNDRFGHSAGDEALRAFGALCSADARGGDAAGRIGGEEFALVLPGADAPAALVVAERLRLALGEASPVEGLVLSASFGIAVFPVHADAPGPLLHAADQALYAAKDGGRDRSVVFGDKETAGAPTAPATALRAHLSAVLMLAETLDLRDSGTAQHSQTVGRYAELVARRLGLPELRVERVRLAGILHDIGKVGVPDHVLRKPTSLDQLEWGEIRKHPELGARILTSAELHDLASWVLAHHERLDGLGYPNSLAGEEIPLEARILAVADSYEAMTSQRVYSRPIAHAAAIAELRRHAGTQFDEAVVEAFAEALAGDAELGLAA